MTAIARTFFHVPVFGWLLKDAVHGAVDAKYYFFGNLVAVLAVLVYMVGYPLLIVLALTMAAAVLSMILILTATDLIDQRTRRTKAHATRTAALARRA
ncbi:hypothetical protein [Undibacter mobilis]|uniref:Uncharacterized protein n=1 Tax=Undibacter mobilis TaxID=2292256 RepID=A0A371B769_9BRAD|nr:hypothetical protein [Undibacter mobilis]RDV03394.1 hypothetical protein DXH78_01580 [Undibacter mobilis]